jgi:nucleoside 2-deoxyribosyltransferase
MHKAEYVYVASSWRNPYQEAAVATLRAAGIECYDFKDSEGFHWKEVGLAHDGTETFEQYLEAVNHPRALQGFNRDFAALQNADCCLLVLPCNRSAHLEAGWAIGQGKPTCIWIPEYDEPELMYLMADCVTESLLEVLGWMGVED